MNRPAKSSQISAFILAPGNRKWILGATLILTIVSGIFLPKLQFQFELETLFAENQDFAFYKDHVEEFGFDNDYVNILVVPDSGSIYQWELISEMKAITEQLESIAEVEFVYSPLDLKKVIKGPSGVQTYPLFSSATKLSADQKFIENDPYLSQAFPGEHVLVILIKHRHFLDSRESDQFMDKIHPVASQIKYEHHLVGRLPAEKEFLSFIKTDFSVFLALSLVICAMVLWWICRSPRLVGYPFLTSVLSLIWTFGLMGALNVPVTIMTSLLPPIVLFVACSDTIHLISAFRKKHDAKDAIKKVFAPTFLTSITTGIGFLSLILVPIRLISDMGWVTAISVVFAFIHTYALAPFFLKGQVVPKNSEANLREVLTLTSRFPGIIVSVFLLISGTGLWATMQLKVDAYLLHDMPPESQTLSSFQFADDQLGGSKPFEIAIWPTDTSITMWDGAVQREIAKIVNYLEQEYPVANVLAPSKILQYARHARHGTFDVGTPTRQDQLLARRMERRTNIQLVSADEKKARITGNIREYGSLNTDERNASLHAFIKQSIDSKILQYRLTGTNHLIDQTHKLLAGSMAKSLGWAVLIVSLLFGCYFRSVKWALIALIPNVVPLLITGLLLYLLRVPIQLSTSLIFVLVFGIVVDDTIHFLATFKRSPEVALEDKLRYTMDTSGRGMLNTTLTLVAGFSLFLLSGFGGTYYLGFFICIALIAALITDWLLLPVILRKLTRK